MCKDPWSFCQLPVCSCRTLQRSWRILTDLAQILKNFAIDIKGSFVGSPNNPVWFYRTLHRCCKDLLGLLSFRIKKRSCRILQDPKRSCEEYYEGHHFATFTALLLFSSTKNINSLSWLLPFHFNTLTSVAMLVLNLPQNYGRIRKIKHGPVYCQWITTIGYKQKLLLLKIGQNPKSNPKFSIRPLPPSPSIVQPILWFTQNYIKIWLLKVTHLVKKEKYFQP